ncbi:MAG: serine/threonine-protein kinase, partial [Acidimicrobiales bacterium]|nr:serine/threonine-protein kinase [Acidimicrobiales bacterium]
MLRAGDLIDGRYVVRDLLGRGGMAEVHRVTDVVDGRAYALKVTRGAEPGLEDRFRREVAALARLDHPGLVRLHRAGAHRGDGYLLLDLADGPPLSQELSDGPAGFERTVALGQQVATALAHVHRAGLVHRDVKPSNILLHRDRALLADFGIARLPGAPALTLTGQVIGSAPYLAPEQVEGEPAGPPADVYALGLVLIECLTGARCYPGTYVESAIARLHRAPEIPVVPPWLRDVLVAMTDRQPTRRPPAGAVAEALARRDSAGAVAATVPLALTPDSVPQREGGRDVRPPPWVRRGRPRSGRRVGAWVLAGAAAVLVTLGWTVMGGDPPSQPAVTQPTTPPTTAPAPVADPVRPTSAAESPQGGREDRADRTAVQEIDATSAPVV